MISHRSNFGKSKSPKTKPAVTFNMLPFVLTTLKIHQPQSNHFQKNFDETLHKQTFRKEKNLYIIHGYFPYQLKKSKFSYGFYFSFWKYSSHNSLDIFLCIQMQKWYFDWMDEIL